MEEITTSLIIPRAKYSYLRDRRALVRETTLNSLPAQSANSKEDQMTSVTIPLAVVPLRGGTVRSSRLNRPLLVAAAIFLVVLIANIAIIAAAAPNLAQFGSLYVTST
jgi:hypothetical protein